MYLSTIMRHICATVFVSFGTGYLLSLVMHMMGEADPDWNTILIFGFFAVLFIAFIVWALDGVYKGIKEEGVE